MKIPFEYPLFSGWSKSGVLRQGVSDASAFSGQTGDFKYPQVITAQFGIVPKVAGKSIIAKAEIDFGCAGNWIKRIINVGDGVSITGVANQVVMRVIDATPAALIDSPIDYVVTALVVPGSRGSMANPPVYRPELMKNIPNATTADWAIPKNAGVTSAKLLFGAGVSVTSAFAWRVIVEQRNAAQVLARQSAIIDHTFMPVDSAATLIRVYNDTGAAIDAQVVFGIDG